MIVDFAIEQQVNHKSENKLTVTKEIKIKGTTNKASKCAHHKGTENGKESTSAGDCIVTGEVHIKLTLMCRLVASVLASD